MNTDWTCYSARLRLDPRYERDLLEDTRAVAHVVIAGYHAAFAAEPRPGTVLAPFPGVDLARPTPSTVP
ncbi:hypothetical protein [Nocardia sp. NPDC057030]|uniref:hypothetical protein n=1 Tax=unclassified Nocardia TaxID=2637762 RepID=UPI003643592C